MISYHVMLMGVLMMEVVMGVIWQLQLVAKYKYTFSFTPQHLPPPQQLLAAPCLSGLQPSEKAGEES